MGISPVHYGVQEKKILEYFYENPKARLGMSELGRKLGLLRRSSSGLYERGNISNRCKKLINLQILNYQIVGKEKILYLDIDLGELKEILETASFRAWNKKIKKLDKIGDIYKSILIKIMPEFIKEDIEPEADFTEEEVEIIKELAQNL